MSSPLIAYPLDPDDRTGSPLRVELRADAPLLHLAFRDLAVRREDVLPLRAAFEDCSPDELLAAVLRHEAGWRIRADALESRTYAMLMRKVTDALDAMMQSSSRSPAAAPSRIIAPLGGFSADRDGRSLEYVMGAALFDREDAETVEKALRLFVGRASTWDELRRLREDIVDEVALGTIGYAAMRGSAAELSRLPWEDALGMPVWVPSGFSDRERYALLAKVFWAMTYRGFTPDERRRAGWEEAKGARDGIRPMARILWPSDPMLGLLEHGCWVDALEMHTALFAVMAQGNTPVTEAHRR